MVWCGVVWSGVVSEFEELGFWGDGMGCGVWGVGCRLYGAGCSVWGVACRELSLCTPSLLAWLSVDTGSTVQGSGFRCGFRA